MNNILFSLRDEISVNPIIVIFFAICIILSMVLLRTNYLYQIKVSLYIDIESTAYNKTGFIKFLKRKKNLYINGSLVLIKIKNLKYLYDISNNKHVLMETITQAILRVLDKGEMVARLEQNVFIVCLRVNDREALQNRVNTISDSLLNEPMPAYGLYAFDIAFSIYAGITGNFAKDVEKTFLPLVYGRTTNNVFFYEDEIGNIERKLEKIDRDKEQALKDGAFVGYIQPKVSLTNGEVIGGEILVRWLDSNQNQLYYPGEFVPLFEQSGFIANIDMAMFEQVCQLQETWKKSGKKAITLSFNLSRANLKNLDYIKRIEEIYAKYDVDPSLIEIEITETALTENTNVVSSGIMMLKKFGFKIAMDDFGQEYSSLTSLIDNPFDTIKLDKKFVENNLNTEREQLVLENIVRMVKQLKLQVVLEGVETDSALKHICNIENELAVQGYCFSKPVPLARFEVMTESTFRVYPKEVRQEKLPNNENVLLDLPKNRLNRIKDETDTIIDVIPNSEDKYSDVYERTTKNKNRGSTDRNNYNQNQSQQSYGPNQGQYGYGPNQQGYGPNYQNYGPNQQGYGPNQQGYGPNQQGYGPNQQGYGPNQQGYGPNQQGYGPNQGQYGYGSNQYGDPNYYGYSNSSKGNDKEQDATRKMLEKIIEQNEINNQKIDMVKHEIREDLKNDIIGNLLYELAGISESNKQIPAPASSLVQNGRVVLDLDDSTLPNADDSLDDDDEENVKPKYSMKEIEDIVLEYKSKYQDHWQEKVQDDFKDKFDDLIESLNIHKELKKSFKERILSTNENNQKIYNIIKNEFMKYNNVRNTINKSADFFLIDKEVVAKIKITRSVMKLYLKLNIKDYPIGQYKQKDVSKIKVHEKTPFMINVKSGLAVKRALTLINDLFVINRCSVRTDYAIKNYVSLLEKLQ